MIKQTIAILLLLHSSLQDCGDGCLRCVTPPSDNAVPECAFCDTFSHFVLKDGACVAYPDLQCDMLTQNGECLWCAENHYIDLATQKCLQVDLINRVDKCYSYNDKQQCQMCVGPFALTDNKCLAITQVISHCELYNDQTECLLCEQGYYFDPVIKMCMQLNAAPECISHSRFECFKCEKGLVLDPNYYFESKFLFQSSIDNQYIFEIKQLQQLNIPVIRNDILQCRNTQLTNCDQALNYKQCATCKKGYYLLSTGVCKEYPKQPIHNCHKYSSFNVCQECVQGAVITGLGKCRLLENREFISNCNTYSQTARIALCTSCSIDYYVYDNRCIERLNKVVEGCAVFDLFADKCSSCGEGQIIGTDGLNCLNVIENCKTHQAFNQQTKQEELVCTQCMPEYFLDQNQCIAGSSTNCRLYQLSADICVECQEKYYGAPDCKEHGEVEFCEKYSKVELNKCTECQYNRRTFNWLEKCQDLPKIDNCITYEDNTNAQSNLCSVCADGFALTSSKTCDPIDVDLCIEADWQETQEDVCEKCSLDYGLVENNQTNKKSCQSPFSYLTEYCDSMNQSQTDFHDFECQVCKVHSVPFNMGTHNICVESSKLDLLQNAVTLIDNCEMYRSATQCQRCAQGWYLKRDYSACLKNECVDGSGDRTILNAIYVEMSSVFAKPIQNYCNSIAATDESYINAPDLTNAGAQVTVGCTGNYIKVYNQFGSSTVKYSNVNPANKQASSWVDHFMDVYPDIDCPSKAVGDNINGVVDRDTLPECEGYVESSSRTFKCVKCPFGKSGQISSQGFIESCPTMNNCSTNKFKNILPYWEQLFSCHECTEENKIPVIAYQATSTTNHQIVTASPFQKFTLTTNENWTNIPSAETQLSNNIFCMDVSSEESIRSTLHVEYTDSNYGKVIPLQNCGLAGLDLQQSNSFDNSKSQTNGAAQVGQALFCAACKPGYKPSYQGIHTYQCERIDNCQEKGEWFNACSACYPGYRYYHDTTKINFDQCVRIPFNKPGLDHCLAYYRYYPNDDSNLTGHCRICEKGYTLNADDFCEKVQVPNCDNNFFRKTYSQLNHQNNLKYNLYYNISGNGCNKCLQGYHSLPSSLFNVSSYCIASSYLQEHQLEFPTQAYILGSDPKDSLFIDKCVKYQANSSPKCAECIEGYILRNDNGACIDNTLFPNCKLFDATDFNCVQCNDGYSLVTGVYTGCILNDIENCTSYNENTPYDKVTCLSCNDGFYLKDNKCHQGHIPNCAKYQEENICQQCEEGYWSFGMESGNLTYTTATTYSCIEKANETNCKVPNFSNSLGDFRCTTCDFPYQKIVNNQHGVDLEVNKQIELSLCLAIGSIENCEEYDKELYLNKRIFKCLKCSTQNYLNSEGTQCIERTNFFDTCKTYSATQDICLECKDNYLLSDDKTACLDYPQGIVNCSVYTANSTDGFQCSQCTNQTYLENDKCVDIIKDHQVENCAVYIGPSECSICNTGYILENEVCVKIDLIDCKEPLSSTECKVCNQGFRLFSDDGLNKCISLDKRNCLQFVQNSYNKCLLCKTHYYPDENGDCQIVENIIQNCIVYSGRNKCRQCQPEYALKWDQSECISKEDFDSKCTVTVHTAVPICNVCQAGYHLKNGRCVPFMENIKEGCFYYNKKSDRCQFCNIYYHMNADGECLLDSDQLVDEQTGDDGNDSNDDQQQNGVFKFNALLAIVLVVLFN